MAYVTYREVFGPQLALYASQLASPTFLFIQSLVIFALAVGIWFKKQWARVTFIVLGVAVIVFRGTVFFALLQKYGVERAPAPVTLGMVITFSIIIYLNRQRIARLFRREREQFLTEAQ